MDLKSFLLTSVFLVVLTCSSAKYLPENDNDDDYYYNTDTIDDLFPDFRPSFQPSITKCCKLGEKVAKKGMSCSSRDHLNLYTESWEEHVSNLMGHDNIEHDIPDHIIELLKKSQVCLLSDNYFPNFKKCCHYRKNYQTALQACRKYKGGSKRRECRKQVHWQYP